MFYAVILGVAQDLEGEICQYFIFGSHFGSHFKIDKLRFQQDIITNKFLNPQMIGIVKSARKVMPSSNTILFGELLRRHSVSVFHA